LPAILFSGCSMADDTLNARGSLLESYTKAWSFCWGLWPSFAEWHG
jgi:hypothetical protein